MWGASYILSSVFTVVPAIAPASAVCVRVSFIKTTLLRFRLCVPKRSRGKSLNGCTLTLHLLRRRSCLERSRRSTCAASRSLLQ